MAALSCYVKEGVSCSECGSAHFEERSSGLHTGFFPGGRGKTLFFLPAEERVWLLGHTFT